MALLEGGHYGLVSHRDYGSGKSLCVYVKITDSSQKAIEDYIASKAASRNKPTIRLVDQDVILKIPDPHGGAKAFTLHLQELSADSYDCIRRKDSSELELLDTMVHKLTVRATEDVYQTTKEKVASVDVENKKNCAKEIKPGGKGVGKKVKKVVRNGGIVTRTVPVPSSAAIKVASRSTVSPSSRASPPAVPPSAAENRLGAAAKLVAGSSGNGHQVRRQAAAVGAAVSPLNSVPAANKPKNTELLAVPLRQRVIHVLAVRPYTKAELKVKLNADGLSPADHDELNSLVTSVATVNRAKQLVLLNGCYKEVDVNWKFYSDADKQLVRRRQATMVEGGPKLGNSHGAPAPFGAPTRAVHTENPLKRSPSSQDHSSSSGGNKRPRLSTTQSTQRNAEVKNHTVKSSESFTTDDYLSRYTRLSEPEQRQKYKEDFNHEYEEYLRLHKALEKVSRKFAELADRLNQTADGSAEHSAIEKEIRREYRLVKADSKYSEQKRRMEYLHGKLSHIKELVVDYDSRMASAADAGGFGGGGGGS